MSQQSFHQPGFPLHLEELKGLFSEVITITILGVSLFAVLGILYSDRASAEMLEQQNTAVTSGQFQENPTSISTSATRLGEDLALEFAGALSADCLVSTIQEPQLICSSDTPPDSLRPLPSIEIDLHHQPEPLDFLRLIEIEI